jgi:hypothetical protein
MAGITENRGGWNRGRWRIAAWAAIPALLLVPLIGVLFTDSVDWTLFDFIFAAALMSAALGAVELALRMTSSLAYRAGAVVAVAAAFMLIWITGAVGIIGTEDNDANLMFFAVLAVALAGSVVAWFRAEGMARAMAATAIAQAVVGAIALIGWMGDEDPNWPFDLVGLTGGFVGMWVLAAWLFWQAGGERTGRGLAS